MLYFKFSPYSVPNVLVRHKVMRKRIIIFFVRKEFFFWGGSNVSRTITNKQKYDENNDQYPRIISSSTSNTLFILGLIVVNKIRPNPVVLLVVVVHPYSPKNYKYWVQKNWPILLTNYNQEKVLMIFHYQ